MTSSRIRSTYFSSWLEPGLCMVIYGQGERSVEDRALVQVRFSDYRRAWVVPRSSEVAADGRRVEVTTLNMLLRSDARRERDDLLDIALSLPFQGEVNTGFGVLAKVYLDALTHLNSQQRVHDPNAEGVREAKAMALEICEETFPGVKSPRMEVERGFRFWDVVSDRIVGRVWLSDTDRELQALTAMRQLHSEQAVLPELIDQCEAAEAWLGPRRP